MKIVKVEPIILSLPLERPVRTSFGEMKTRTGVFVKIEADTGEFGIGEIWNNFPSWGVHEKLATLKYGIEPLLIGENPEEIEKINYTLHNACTILGLQWGALGPVYHSISGIDIALWDLVGKHYNKPIYQLLGEELADEIEVYASGLGPLEFESLVEQHQEMGITQFKLKVGAGIETDLANLKKIRKMIDPEDKLMIDANQAWDRRSALEHLHQFQAFDLTWVEEPVRCDDLEGLQTIRKQSGIPVAAGENLYGRFQVLKAFEQEAVDIIQPDLSKNGGISEARVVAEIARSWEVPFAPHFLSGAVCFVASLHFMAGVPGGKILEMDANPNPLREKLFTVPIKVNNGKVKVPEAPGLGLELDEDFMNYYKVNLNEL